MLSHDTRQLPDSVFILPSKPPHFPVSPYRRPSLANHLLSPLFMKPQDCLVKTQPSDLSTDAGPSVIVYSSTAHHPRKWQSTHPSPRPLVYQSIKTIAIKFRFGEQRAPCTPPPHHPPIHPRSGDLLPKEFKRNFSPIRNVTPPHSRRFPSTDATTTTTARPSARHNPDWYPQYPTVRSQFQINTANHGSRSTKNTQLAWVPAQVPVIDIKLYPSICPFSWLFTIKNMLKNMLLQSLYSQAMSPIIRQSIHPHRKKHRPTAANVLTQSYKEEKKNAIQPSQIDQTKPPSNTKTTTLAHGPDAMANKTKIKETQEYNKQLCHRTTPRHCGRQRDTKKAPTSASKPRPPKESTKEINLLYSKVKLACYRSISL